MTLARGALHLAGRVWNLIEPMIEHGLIAILVACIIFLVSRVLEILVGGTAGRYIHAFEAFCYTVVTLLYMLHALSILSIRLVRDTFQEVRRPAGTRPALGSLLRYVPGRRTGVGEKVAYAAEPGQRSVRPNQIGVRSDDV
jgi:hypothetical protein